MIVKNEEAVLARCLDSIKEVVDEINIVDTGSTDQTKSIAAKYTSRVFDFQWVQHFAAARNFSFQHATKDYILWLDADDVVTVENQEKLQHLKSTLSPATDAVSMDYLLSFDEQGNSIYSLRRNRLVKRQRQFQWIGAVHEYLAVDGTIVHSDIAINHQPLSHDASRNIAIYEQLLEAGEIFSPRDLYYYANELKDHSQYAKAIDYYEKFLATEQGWVEDCIQACFKIADCYSALQNDKLVIQSVVKSLTFDAPRPEACCRLGFYFMEQYKNEQAIYWYTQALSIQEPDHTAFRNLTFTTWLPHLQLCVLYDRLQQFELAYKHHKQAKSFAPQHPQILHNEHYFQQLFSK
ncbi:glycosyltransferase [Metasolibacillus meyeri]|uniref:Glycosyltransferase n=1 Tax=Metasolibacillus meyeri TaxID=1071052 RepID=A0AAW9NN69_9BACL|nr:glycosyltransferase [Metasolibacillus meyeri]MEC1178972.1 glycosyltransferase [Metasolibacillus meyeri]